MKRIMRLLVAAMLLFAACTDDDDNGDETEKAVQYPDVKLSAMAEMQYLAPGLITMGESLELYLGKNYKMLAQSAAIFQAGLLRAAAGPSEAILIAGDLTAGGSKTSHRQVATMLAQVEASGKDVFVIPGPHDVNNYQAVKFTQTGYESVEHINPEGFASIYQDFGYDKAIAKDPASLSYITRIKEGLRLLAIDACRYDENTPDTLMEGGAIGEATMGWIMQQLKTAREKDVKVIAMMNHNAVAHYLGHEKSMPQQLLAGGISVADSLANAGVSMLITGSSEGIDIVRKPTAQDRMILDIQAGSPLIYPSTYRNITISNGNALHVSDAFIDQIQFDTGDKTFPEYAENYITESLNRIIPYKLEPYGLTQEEMEMLQPLMVGGMKAFLAGNEQQAWNNLPDSTRTKIEGWLAGNGGAASEVGGLVYGLYHDTSPSDRDVTLSLRTGKMIEN